MRSPVCLFCPALLLLQTNIMAGYRLAMKEAVRYIKSHLTITSDKMERCVHAWRDVPCGGGNA